MSSVSLPRQTKKPSYYWAKTNGGAVLVLQRSGKTGVWGFGGTKYGKEDILAWGEQIVAPDMWLSDGPAEDGWYGIKYEDGSFGVVRVALGQRVHCYDFSIPHEIEIKRISGWNGPLREPSLPKPV